MEINNIAAGKVPDRGPSPPHVKEKKRFSPKTAGDSFAKSPPPSGKVMKNLVNTANEEMGQVSGAEVWSFKTETLGMLRTSLTSRGSLLCQDQHKIYVLDGETGDKKWEFGKERGGISSLASGQNGMLYLDEALDNKVVALDEATGEEKWRFDLAKDERSVSHLDVLVSKDDSSLYLGGLLSKDGAMYKKVTCLDAKTGKAQWRAKFPSNTISSMKMSPDGRSLMITLTDSIVSLDVQSGKKRWELNTEGTRGNFSPSIGSKGSIYFVGEDKKIHAIDGDTGKEKWQFPIRDDMSQSPIAGSDGMLYAFGRHKIQGLDEETGKVQWEYGESRQKLQNMGAQPDGTLLCYDAASHQLHVLEGSSGEVKKSYPLEKTWFIGEAAPNGFIYYMGEDHKKVHAIKLELEAKDVKYLYGKDPDAESGPKIEQHEGHVVIAGVKLPIQGGKDKQMGYCLLRKLGLG